MIKNLKYNYNRFKYLTNFHLQCRNAWFRKLLDQPLPPPFLVFLVQWDFNLEKYWYTGMLDQKCILNAARNYKIRTSSILDFGCGCGRVIRHWVNTLARGCDYNPKLISWCERNLPDALFKVNVPHKPLDFKADSFDLIYALSVFTHLDDSEQEFLFKDFYRLLRPDGYIVLSRLNEKYRKFLSGSKDKYVGTNLYLSDHIVPTDLFSILVEIPFGVNGLMQDMIIMSRNN